MEKLEDNKNYKNWRICLYCQGRGKKSRKISKKVRLNYERAIAEFEKSNLKGIAPIRPSGHLFSCPNCSGSGLVPNENPTVIDNENYPHIAIIGAGIGGVALAVACLHRGIPFTIYERDENFNARSQGYGLTLQQASKAMSGLGILFLDEGVISTKHIVHTNDGKMIGEWGVRKWDPTKENNTPKKSNIHIARQSLRLALIEQLGGHDKIKWGHQLISMEEIKGDCVSLSFEVNGKIENAKADLVVGADGIRSAVRKLLIGDELAPLRYLDCIVILGICPLISLEGFQNPLLDSETVFQTANGHERVYIMPYTSDSVMWQLSFPMTEKDAKILSAKGAQSLKEEAISRTDWHEPVPQIIKATLEAQITGYPVYDRELLPSELLNKIDSTTLIGDAAHPMSPFKGQGANQALLDALKLARTIFKNCGAFSKWKKTGIRDSVLTEFESEMLHRSASKVKDSAEAVQFLHSDIILRMGNSPRGK